MHWFHSQRTTRALASSESRFGSTAVIGLESMRDLASLTRTYGFRQVQAIRSLHAAEVHLDGRRLHELLASAPSDPRLRYVSPVGPTRDVLNMPSDPLVQTDDPTTRLPYEWQFGASNLEGALDLTPGDPRIKVGVIDTGVDVVPDLAGKVDALYDVTGRGTVRLHRGNGNDDYGHGTAAASLIAAGTNDGFGMSGFGGAAHVIGVHAGVEGRFTDGDVAQALARLDSLGVRIVNLSLGGSTPPHPILVDAINKAATDGVLIVAASGNDGVDVAYPAALLQQSGGSKSYGLAVGATNADGTVADFSNFGEHLSLVAPGNFKGDCTGVLVALPPTNALPPDCYRQWTGAGGARYGYVAGTSFASPEVAGVAALVWAARPELKNYQVAAIIKASADRDPGAGWTPTLGCGRLDAQAAVELALSRTPGEWASDDSVAPASCSASDASSPSLLRTQRITFPAIANRTTADGDFKVTAHASSGLPVTYYTLGACTIRHTVVHVTEMGICTITAKQAGDDEFAPAFPMTQNVAITYAVTPTALRSVGKAGELVPLRYRTSAFGIVATNVVVKRGTRTIARLRRGSTAVEPDAVYSIAWHAPPAADGAGLRFCVTLNNRTPGAPRRSFTSCAPIRVTP